MAQRSDGSEEFGVLRSKRTATRYQIMVEIAERQPAVSQQEIADAIGITSQAVSDYLQGLSEEGHVTKHGRGRYEVTKEGVDWLISQTDALRSFVGHVSEDIIGQVDIETVLATSDIAEGETVSVTMREGVLRAVAGDTGNATAVAVTDAAAGTDLGITNVEGVVEYDLGDVTAVSIPRVQNDGSGAADADRIAGLATDHDLVAVAGVEALAAARAADVAVDIRYGSVAAVEEAATKGQDVLLLASADQLSTHTDALAGANIGYEVLDAAE
ncbi:MarR family transcriptional regulator [Haloarcula salinisoli]|uniref:Winged helix-turn-helix transcriptional regulator n=1 Tax=Haloarcula salinisoli TaxID=2487746 RepID=A0A8J7YI57_9EURY|nr:MarR family transcriptional regulator [Halomicroarcula salinisoli]MBX0288266.1 winged helix-turn-helix transcriptional regulator [Halomicroarcula salinisoli]MBX0305927.1 winged helix-turn-helix transcriptional regulator [Halomicroarcula salinisoli]